MHTHNLALKDICAAKNTEANENVITIVVGDAFFIRNFIVNHSTSLTIFDGFVNLKMLTIA